MSGTITINNEPHQIETKPVTLVFNASGLRTEYPDRIMITPEMSLNRYRQLGEIDRITAALFRIVVPDFDRPVSREELDKCCDGFQHLAGLLSLTVRFIAHKHQFGWSYPETGLQPRYQANLADVIVLLTNAESMDRFVKSLEVRK